MFSNTNDFFEEVVIGNATVIDIKNYVKKISDNHNLENIKTILNDLEFFKYTYLEEIESKITTELINKKINDYDLKGIELPIREHKNHINISLNKKNGNKNLDEVSKNLDLEKMFYTHELFTLNQLENYLKSLIKPKVFKPKHENIFSNNGFVLFEHILNEYVKPINSKGRQTDLIFYHRKMYETKPQYIHQKPTDFFIWFDNEYEETTGQLKTLLQVENPQRNKDFSNALNWFKLQNY
jgi:hypothetical protein